MIKPFQIFVFGISVILALFCISIFTTDGKWDLGFMVIHIPTFTDQSIEPKKKYKDISNIIQFGKALDSIVTVKPLISNNKKRISIRDSNYVAFNKDSIKGLEHPLQFPEGNDTLLNPFFEELEQLPSDKKLIRILHYGDSQIEGDRITSYLRSQLQSKFGGEGIGLFPIVPTNPSSIAYNYDVSSNWVRYSPMDHPNKAPHNKYGVLMNFSRLKPNSGLFEKKSNVEGWIKLNHTSSSYFRAQQFNLCKIYYGYNTSPILVEIKQKNTLIDSDIVPPSTALNSLTWKFNHAEKDLTITIKSDSILDFFGISLTGTSGVVIDNIPIRGSSGLEFTRSNKQLLTSFFKQLDVKLLIMQFGVNVVPNVTSQYDYYEKNFLRQLQLLKQINPGMQIIVIGVSDVSRNGESGYESYPNIEKIRDAQRTAAFTAGCAFWDMFEAMGGKNSMPSWVSASPALAQKDFTHLTPAGAKIIGEMFYRSLISEFNRFSLTHKKTKA